MFTTDSTLRVVLYEGAAARPLDPSNVFAMATALLEKGFAVSRAPVRRPVATERQTPTLVLGEFADPANKGATEEKALTWGNRFQDITGLNAAAIAGVAESIRAEGQAAPRAEWKPWFPVIDYDRCTNCMQCLSFCLFGVYGVDDQQKIQVQNQDQCKTNCPACSRVCPEAAIMFPKYSSGPINGDIVREGDLGREKMKVDISALLGGDVYAALRQRSGAAKERFSKERDEKKALQERQKCLAKLAQGQGIPMEVLMSLPSPDEIQRRAEEARSKAIAALAAQPK